MTGFVGFLLVAMLVMLLVPDSPTGKLFHRHLVERPLERVANLKRHHLILVVLMAGIMISGGEIMALAGPEFIAAYAVDMALYLDLVIVSYAVVAVRRAKAAIAYLHGGMCRLLRRPEAGRRKRIIRKKGTSGSANDDDADPAFAALAA